MTSLHCAVPAAASEQAALSAERGCGLCGPEETGQRRQRKTQRRSGGYGNIIKTMDNHHV